METFKRTGMTPTGQPQTQLHKKQGTPTSHLEASNFPVTLKMTLLLLTRPPVCDPQAHGHAWVLEQPQLHLLKQKIEVAQCESSHFLPSYCSSLLPNHYNLYV